MDDESSSAHHDGLLTPRGSFAPLALEIVELADQPCSIRLWHFVSDLYACLSYRPKYQSLVRLILETKWPTANTGTCRILIATC